MDLRSLERMLFRLLTPLNLSKYKAQLSQQISYSHPQSNHRKTMIPLLRNPLLYLIEFNPQIDHTLVPFSLGSAPPSLALTLLSQSIASTLSQPNNDRRNHALSFQVSWDYRVPCSHVCGPRWRIGRWWRSWWGARVVDRRILGRCRRRDLRGIRWNIRTNLQYI